MAFKLIYLSLATQSFDRIYYWGVQDSGKRAALRFVNKIDKKIKELKKNPYVGPVELLLEDRSIEYHSLVVHPYFKAIYYIDVESQIIYVADIWDTRMDPEDLQSHINRKF